MSQIRGILVPVVSAITFVAVAVVGAQIIFHRPLWAMPRNQLLQVEPSPKFVVTARQGQVVTASFAVKNVAGQPIALLGARSSCSCTVVTTDFPFELEPGQSGTLVAQMTVGNPDSSGKFAKNINLFVNREGMVPLLTLEAVVVGSPVEPMPPK